MSDPDNSSAQEQQETDIDQQEAERQLQAGAAAHRRKKRLYDLIRDTLPSDTRNYAVADVLDERVEATLDARGVTSEGGPPGVVGELLLSIDNLIEKLGGAVVMRRLDFQHSVHVVLEPEVPEPVRRRARERAERDPDGIVQHEHLVELIPVSVAAANAAARIIAAPSNDALKQARRFGAGVPDAYVRLARTVEETGGKLVVRAPGRKEVSLTASRAERVIAQLGEPRSPLDSVPLDVAGVLTRTDSEERQFRLVLDRERMPDLLDKRKRHIEGGYTPTASRQVQQEGLWDQRVIAKVLAYPAIDPLTGARRFERFSFRSIRLASD